MGMIYIMLIVSLAVALFFLFSFFWATKTGQFEDDYGPSVRVLFEDKDHQKQKTEQHGNSKV